MEPSDIHPFTDLNVEMSSQASKSKVVKEYWDNLNEDDRKTRLSHLNGAIKSKETRNKIRMAHLNREKPHLHKGGTLIKDGNCISFTCLSHFCKENGLSSGHVCELLQGKRKSVKGWTKWAP